MKVFVRFLFASVLVVMFAGCASDDIAYVPKIPPHAQAKLLDYYAQPDSKVFVIAVDANGDYAFGYDYGKPTLDDAYKVAMDKCNASREATGVIAKPYVYALNNKVVYERMILKAHAKQKTPEEQAQEDEVARQEAMGAAR